MAKTEDLSKPEWCFVRWLQFGRDLEELAHGVRPGHADILVLEHEEIAIPRPGLCLPRSAQEQLGWCLLIGRMVALGLDDDYLPGARSHDEIRIVVDKAIDGETRSRDIAMPPRDFLPTFMALLHTFSLKVGRKLLKCGQRNCNQTCEPSIIQTYPGLYLRRK